MNYFFLLILITSIEAMARPLKDSVLFAFERCKSLEVDLEYGKLKELIKPPFDVHCKKINDSNTNELNCVFYNPQNNKILKEEIFTGDSDLGSAELKNINSSKINFLIGKKFASFRSFNENIVCIGFYLFEQEAIKKKKSN